MSIPPIGMITSPSEFFSARSVWERKCPARPAGDIFSRDDARGGSGFVFLSIDCALIPQENSGPVRASAPSGALAREQFRKRIAGLKNSTAFSVAQLDLAFESSVDKHDVRHGESHPEKPPDQTHGKRVRSGNGSLKRNVQA
jgi:hypothetical protein